jgi:hypothetical protein
MVGSSWEIGAWERTTVSASGDGAIFLVAPDGSEIGK